MLPEPACVLALATRSVLIPRLSDAVVAKINGTSPDTSLGADGAGRRVVFTSGEVQEIDRVFRKLADLFSLRGDHPTAAVCIQAAENARRALDETGMSR